MGNKIFSKPISVGPALFSLRPALVSWGIWSELGSLVGQFQFAVTRALSIQCKTWTHQRFFSCLLRKEDFGHCIHNKTCSYLFIVSSLVSWFHSWRLAQNDSVNNMWLMVSRQRVKELLKEFQSSRYQSSSHDVSSSDSGTLNVKKNSPKKSPAKSPCTSLVMAYSSCYEGCDFDSYQELW